MSSDTPQPQLPEFKSRAERRRYERAQQHAAKAKVVRRKPRATTREAARALVLPTRAQERPQTHVYGPAEADSPADTCYLHPEFGPRAIIMYDFTVYRADGQRAVSHLVAAKLAFHHANAGESTLEAARRMAHASGCERLIDDILDGEPEEMKLEGQRP